MTTSDTEGTIIAEPRSLDVLLKCKTYQGMTDEEIASVIAFKEEQARAAAQAEEVRAANSAFVQEMRDHWSAQAEAADEAYRRALEVKVEFERVGSDVQA